jgi:hypothetical protein
MSAIEISTATERLDAAMIHDFLSRQSYWAEGRTRETVERTIRHSLCVGTYADDGQSSPVPSKPRGGRQTASQDGVDGDQLGSRRVRAAWRAAGGLTVLQSSYAS